MDERAGGVVDGAYGITENDALEAEDGPVQTSSWLGLTFAFVVGLVLSAQGHVGVHAAGVTLLVMLVPITFGAFVAAFRRGFGTVIASLTTAAALLYVLVKFFF